MSIDTRMHRRLVELLQLEGFDARYRGDYSIENLTEDKKAFITHHARGAYRYRYTPSQTDVEALVHNMWTGKLPAGIRVYITAHRHTTEGSMEHLGIKIIRCPCFTTFIPYSSSLKMFPHYQPDIGAFFIIVTKEGRIITQEWLYPTFLYHDVDDKIYMAEKRTGKEYATIDNMTLETKILAQIKQAQKVVMVIADLHVGEKESVSPPTFTINDVEKPVLTTKANDKLYEYWRHLAYMSRLKFKVDEVWVIGDVFGGGLVFEKFRTALTKSLEEQVYIAVELFRLLK